MIISRKIRLLFSFILAAVCAISFAAEPNETTAKLTFETDNRRSQLWLGGRPNTQGRGPIQPSHVAVLHIRRPHIEMPSSHDGIVKVLRTSAAKSLSEKQRKFVTGSDAITWWGIDDVRNHDTVFVYGVSEEDVKKTVRAYLEVAEKQAEAERKRYEEILNEAKARLDEIERELPEKRKQAKEAEAEYKDVKKGRYFSLSDVEAYERAKETMLQMDKMLDVLEIELAGIREKLGAINEYRKTPQSMEAIDRRRKLPEGMLLKLEQMYVEETIELKSAEARKQAALNIRSRDKAFLELFNQWQDLESAGVDRLLRNRAESQRRVREVEGRMKLPDENPPTLYQNKATIYPVITD